MKLWRLSPYGDPSEIGLTLYFEGDVERVAVHLSKCVSMHHDLIEERDQLKAEVERLTKERDIWKERVDRDQNLYDEARAEVMGMRFELQAAVTTNEGFHQEIERLKESRDFIIEKCNEQLDKVTRQSALLDMAVAALDIIAIESDPVVPLPANRLGEMRIIAKDALEKIKKARGE